MILLNSRFKFGEEIKTAEIIDATDKERVRVNGTEFFERVKLTEKDLENLINLLAEGNFGISVLETDVNFETFSEVNKKTDASQTTLPRIPCTN